jgi:CelD/BcsL family acetyltransferase involved in cellulose biosynthesis
METPADISAEECLYVADFIVKREYSRYTSRLVQAMCSNVGPAYAILPAYGFCTIDALQRWQRRTKATGRAGLKYVGKRRFELPTAPFEVFLARFEVRVGPQPEPPVPVELTVKVITTIKGWNQLAGEWDSLLRETPDSTAFQSYALQRIWWRHLSANGWPVLIIVYDRDHVRAIAPFWIRTVSYLGFKRRCLSFIGAHSEVDRPSILRRGDDKEAVAAVFKYLFEHGSLWDAVSLYEQPRDGLVISTVKELVNDQVLIGIAPGPPCAWIDVHGSWDAFLAARSRNLKKNLKRKLKKLEEVGEVKFTTYDTWPELVDGFEVYRQVEGRSWKPTSKLGVAKSKKYWDYYSALLYEFGPRRKLHIRTLSVDGKPIAATFGLLDAGRFLSLHIAHDLDYAQFSPGVLLTAYELEEAHRRPDYSAYEFLGGFLDNKLSWTSTARETQQLYLYQRNALFRAHYIWHFSIEPPLKKLFKQVGLHAPFVRVKNAIRAKIKGADAEARDD